MSVKDESRQTSDAAVERGEDISSPTSDFEVPFKGFEGTKAESGSSTNGEKVPPSESLKLRSILKKKSRFSELDKFFEKCTVSLVKTDLKKLKQIFNKNPSLLVGTICKHKNMTLNCKICKKQYANEKKLDKHHNKKHMIIYKPEHPKCEKRVSFSNNVVVHEVKEYHKCRKCPKYFETYLSLKVHMKEQHRKRKCYICNYCNKKFVDRMFFKVHIKLHCEACGKLFTSKKKCTEHRRSVCKTVKLHACKVCDGQFFSLLGLKDHSYDHMDLTYVCDMCKEQCLSKCAVAHHIYFLHSKRKKRKIPALYKTRKIGTESLFLCKFCDESSVDKDLIEGHVQVLPDLSNRAMSGYKYKYFCDQCPKEFDSEQDLLQHKWTHFLKLTEKEKTVDDKPVTVDDKLVTVDDTLVTVDDKLVTVDDKPVTVDDKLVTVDDKPVTVDNKPVTLKRFYNLNEKIPDMFQPKLLVERFNMAKVIKELEKKTEITKEQTEVSKEQLEVSEKVTDTPGKVTKDVSTKVTDGLIDEMSSDSQSNDALDKSYVKASVSNEKKKPKLNKITDDKPINITDGLINEMSSDSQSSDAKDKTKSDKASLTPNGKVKKKPKKTLLSNFQCPNCSKYFVCNYNLNRHIETMHSDYDKLRCKVCEETFVWPSLLRTHKCIRLKIPEQPFDDARPEIHFDNYYPVNDQYQNNTVTSTQDIALEDLSLNINENDDYMNTVDFDIPAPVNVIDSSAIFTPDSSAVCLSVTPDSVTGASQTVKVAQLQDNRYRLVIQEVPIEF